VSGGAAGDDAWNDPVVKGVAFLMNALFGPSKSGGSSSRLLKKPIHAAFGV
jgi:hypothetical protein